AATGNTPLSYQWMKNGAAISGATGASYTTPVLALSDSGTSYTVRVINTIGNVTSSPAIITVVNEILVAVTGPGNYSFTITDPGSYKLIGSVNNGGSGSANSFFIDIDNNPS